MQTRQRARLTVGVAITVSAALAAAAAVPAAAGARAGMRPGTVKPAVAFDAPVGAAAVAGLGVTHTCSPATFARGALTHCAIAVENLRTVPVNVGVTLRSSANLRFENAAGVTSTGPHRALGGATLAARVPTQPSIAAGASPPGEYEPLTDLDSPLVPFADADEGFVNYTTPGFVYGGVTYHRVGVSTNGYLVVGGGPAAANQSAVPQAFPDAAKPNNVLAPYFADLDVTGGSVSIDTATDGDDDWLVVDWQDVTAKSDVSTHSFQVWIGLDGDTNPGEDVSYVYGPTGGAPTVTVGAENEDGTAGAIYGDPVVEGTELRVTTVPGTPGGTFTAAIDARGLARGAAFVRAVVAAASLPGKTTVTKRLHVTAH
jgi:hypothetical protein